MIVSVPGEKERVMRLAEAVRLDVKDVKEFDWAPAPWSAFPAHATRGNNQELTVSSSVRFCRSASSYMSVVT